MSQRKVKIRVEHKTFEAGQDVAIQLRENSFVILANTGDAFGTPIPANVWYLDGTLFTTSQYLEYSSIQNAIRSNFPSVIGLMETLEGKFFQRGLIKYLYTVTETMNVVFYIAEQVD